MSEKTYSPDPTSNGDIQAEIMRQWYEKNRESWFDRHRIWPLSRDPDRLGTHADEFMLSMLAYARRVNACEVPHGGTNGDNDE